MSDDNVDKMSALAKLAGFDEASIKQAYYPPPQSPYAYGEDHHDDGTFGNTLLAAGGMGLAGAGAHHMLMNSRSDLARKYQLGLGGSVRDVGNKVRGAIGMDPVAQPPSPFIGKLQDAAGTVGGAARNAYDVANRLKKPMMAGVGAAVTGYGLHKSMMGAGHRLGQAYQASVGPHVQSAMDAAHDWAFPQPNVEHVATPAPEGNMFSRAWDRLRAKPIQQPHVGGTAPGTTPEDKVGPGVARRRPAAPPAAAKAEAPKAEAPKAEAPKAEAPKAEAPKAAPAKKSPPVIRKPQIRGHK